MGNYVCQRAIHPGELLKDEVESRGLIQKSLAEQMGIPYTALNDSRRSLTATTAMLFEAAMGVSAGLLMRMQLDYNMQVARMDKKFAARLEAVRESALRTSAAI